MHRTSAIVFMSGFFCFAQSDANAAGIAAPISLSIPKVERLNSTGHEIPADVTMPKCPVGVRVTVMVTATAPATVQYHWETEFEEGDEKSTPPLTLTFDKPGEEKVLTGATLHTGRVTARVGSGVRTKPYTTQLVAVVGGTTTLRSEKVTTEIKCRVIY